MQGNYGNGYDLHRFTRGVRESDSRGRRMKICVPFLIFLLIFAISSSTHAEFDRSNRLFPVGNYSPYLSEESSLSAKWNFKFGFEPAACATGRCSIARITDIADNDSLNSPAQKRHLFKDLKNAGSVYLSDSWHIYSAPARMDRSDVLWLAAIVTVGGTIYAFDQEIHDAFKRNQNYRLYKPIRQLGDNIQKTGHMGVTGKYFFGALATGYIFNIEIVTRISSQIIEAFFITGAVKNVANIVIGRTRPHEGNGPRYFSFNNDGTSFPSGHSINVMEIADVLSHNIEFRPFQLGCYGLATIVCLQRITSDSHWPSDVYFSAIFGWAVSHELQRRHYERRMRIISSPYIDEESAGLVIVFAF